MRASSPGQADGTCLSCLMNPSESNPPAPKPLQPPTGSGLAHGKQAAAGPRPRRPCLAGWDAAGYLPHPRCAPLQVTASRSKSKTLKASVSRHVRERSTPIRGEQFSNSIAQKSEKVQHFLPYGQIWPSPPVRPHLARARVRATTHAAPAARRQAAHWARVAPLVATSSTSTTRFPASSTPGRQS